MSLPNYNNIGGGQYVPAVPPVVDEVLTKLAAIFTQIANLNNLLSAVEADVQKKAAQQEAHYQKKSSRKTAIGEFAMGTASVVGGAVSVGFAANAGAGLGPKANSTAEIDKELGNAKELQEALKANPQANLTEVKAEAGKTLESKPLSVEDQERKDKIDELSTRSKTSGLNEEDKELISTMSEEEKTGPRKEVDGEIKSLEDKKAELENQQRNREVDMRFAEAISTIIQGVGKLGGGVATLQAGVANAQGVIARNVGSLSSSLGSHFSQRSSSYLSYINSLYRTLADMAQTQVTR